MIVNCQGLTPVVVPDPRCCPREKSAEFGDPVRWGDVKEIFAFKRDMFGFDLICLGFRLDGDGTYAEVDEDYDNYQEFLEALPQRFPGIRREWFYDVAFPAFAPCLHSLWGQPGIEAIWKAQQGDRRAGKSAEQEE